MTNKVAPAVWDRMILSIAGAVLRLLTKRTRKRITRVLRRGDQIVSLEESGVQVELRLIR